MADTLLQFEHVDRRSQRTLTSITLYDRVYRMPLDRTIIPVRGQAVDLDGLTGTGINQPRVYSNPQSRRDRTGAEELHITFYQIRPYAEQ